MSVAGLLLAAGEGRRLGGWPKARLVLRGATLLAHGVTRLVAFCDEVVIAVGAGDVAAASSEVRSMKHAQTARVIEGGDSRQQTLLRLLEKAQSEWVLIHEVARPFTPPEAFIAVLAAARQHGAAALFRRLSLSDSVGIIDGSRLTATISRSQVVALQPPLAFRRVDLLNVYQWASGSGTVEEGTAALALRAGIAVHLVESLTENLKITFPEDWERAQRECS
jgi:2-C-methyl-D-erythritol 4-phosphate cytidylyltransferase